MTARLQILMAALMFGTTGTAQALADVGEPVAVGAVRIAIGGGVLVVLAVATGALRGLGRHPVLVLAGGIGVAAYQLAFFAAVEVTGVVVGTVVAIGVGPVATGALEWLINRTRQTVRWAVATGVAATGVIVLTLGSGDEAAVSTTGLGLAVIAGVGYAFYTVIAKRLLEQGCAPTGVMAGAFGVGAILLVPVLAVADLGWLGGGAGLTLALYLGLVPTALAYVLYARGLRRTSAAETATITLAEPATAALLGAVVVGERLGVVSGAGVMLVVAAMMILLALPRRVPVAAST